MTFRSIIKKLEAKEEKH